MGGRPPSLRVERGILRSGVRALACCDEVGRGSLSGPVTVGMVVVTASTRSAPAGVRDSKQVPAPVREELAPRIRAWAADHAVGHASPEEIDAVGLVAALRLAGRRALAALATVPDAVLLDGQHDYLSPPPQESLFALEAAEAAVPPVLTRVRADQSCAGVAAASILAKVARDAIMVDLASQFPEYGWGQNKGYAAPEHLDALRRLGPTRHHRVSWRLPSGVVEGSGGLGFPRGIEVEGRE